MIYFDNAATGGFKPWTVKNEVIKVLSSVQVNAGRGSYETAKVAEKNIYDCRKMLSEHFNNGLIARLIFTPNCTAALNAALFGIKLCGSEIVTSVTEHNSVLRPLYYLKKTKNLNIKFAEPDENNIVRADKILSLVTDKTALVVLNAVSNVTGAMNEVSGVGKALGRKIPFIVDGAQAGGHIKFNMAENGISCLAIAPHKGFYAYQGVGVLALKKDCDLVPTVYGGSGGETFNEVPSAYPEKLEAGTLNYPAIVSLLYGGRYAIENMDYHNARLLCLTNRLICGLEEIKGVKVYSQPNIFGIVSFSLYNRSSMEVADILGSVYDIAVRGGFHCAPLMHKFLKTDDNGLIRASLSPYNTENEVDELLNATEYISADTF